MRIGGFSFARNGGEANRVGRGSMLRPGGPRAQAYDSIKHVEVPRNMQKRGVPRSAGTGCGSLPARNQDVASGLGAQLVAHSASVLDRRSETWVQCASNRVPMDHETHLAGSARGVGSAHLRITRRPRGAVLEIDSRARLYGTLAQGCGATEGWHGVEVAQIPIDTLPEARALPTRRLRPKLACKWWEPVPNLTEDATRSIGRYAEWLGRHARPSERCGARQDISRASCGCCTSHCLQACLSQRARGTGQHWTYFRRNPSLGDLFRGRRPLSECARLHAHNVCPQRVPGAHARSACLECIPISAALQF